MLWIEMARDDEHGGGEWNFLKCLWSPTLEVNGNKQGWWEKQRKISVGDQVLHLRGRNKKAKFVGFSFCATDCEVTDDRPPSPGRWGYATSFFRTRLTGFEPLDSDLLLDRVFAEQEIPLRNYFSKNSLNRLATRRRLFYVIQSNRLQCQNGAYFSEVDSELAEILLSSAVNNATTDKKVLVGERARVILSRLNQDEFSSEVLSNFGQKCCFPGCEISEQSFLIGAHIARWSDVPTLRGDISNGLCFCLMHDKAFERGLFTLDEKFCVTALPSCAKSLWGRDNVVPHEGKKIRNSLIVPSDAALLHHWFRIGY